MTGISAAVVGDPISHSRSPQIHLAAYRALGLDNPEYDRLRIPAGELAQRWRDGEFRGRAGLSVTMPHKQDAARLASSLSERVAVLGAANTLVLRSADEIFAENTDVDGIVNALRRGADQSSFLGRPAAPQGEIRKVLIIGAGGTAVAALAACQEMGVKKVSVALRSVNKAYEGPHSVSGVAESLGLDVRILSFEDVRRRLEKGVDAVISTLPPRAADPFAADWSQAAAASRPVILDAAYDPWPSLLVQNWPGRVVHGLEMLLYQAVRQVELFTGQDVDEKTVSAMAAAVDLPARSS